MLKSCGEFAVNNHMTGVNLLLNSVVYLFYRKNMSSLKLKCKCNTAIVFKLMLLPVKDKKILRNQNRKCL